MRLQRPEHLAEQLRHAADAHQVLVDRGDREQEHHRRGEDRAVVGDLAHLAPRDVAVVELGGEEGVARDHGAGLGRGDDAEDEAAEDHERHHHRHGGMQRGVAEALRGSACVSTGQSFCARADVNHRHQADHDDQRPERSRRRTAPPPRCW